MSNFTPTFDAVAQAQGSKEVTVNAYFDAASPATTYGRQQRLCSGLTWAYYGGNVTIASGAMSQIANGTTLLTLNTTWYMVAAKATGAVSFSTSITNWNDTATYWRLYLITTGPATVTNYIDYREIGKYSTGIVRTDPSLLGYGTGAGGAVTQLTDKTTGVTLSKPCGQITTNAASLAANTTVSFTVTNTLVGTSDAPEVVRQSGGTAAAYQVWCDSVAAGSFVVCIRNITAGDLAETLVLNVNVAKGAVA